MTVTILDHAADTTVRSSGVGARVALRGVTRTFGDRTVLSGINLTIEPGQFVAIVGRSGCGKSTLLRLIAGLDEPTSGSIDIDGSPDGVRLMFQEPRLLPWMRVGANIAVGLPRGVYSGSGRREPDLAGSDILAQVGLAGRERDWPSVLSGGQKQRVALGRALASHPRLLALDEPLGALDALTRIEMQDLISRVWQEKGFTAIVVTHDVTEAVSLADRIVVLDGGRVAMDVAVDQRRPRHRGDAEAAAIEGRVLDRLLQR